MSILPRRPPLFSGMGGHTGPQQKTPRLLLGVRSFPWWLLHMQKTPDVLRARGTLFWPEIARELTKSDGTRTIRSEIARGIDCNRSQGPELAKMRAFDPGVALEYPGVPRGDPGVPQGPKPSFCPFLGPGTYWKRFLAQFPIEWCKSHLIS